MKTLEIKDNTLLQPKAINDQQLIYNDNYECQKNKMETLNVDDQQTREKTFSDCHSSFKSCAKFGKLNQEMFSEENSDHLEGFLYNDEIISEDDDILVDLRCERLRESLSTKKIEPELETADRLDKEI